MYNNIKPKSQIKNGAIISYITLFVSMAISLLYTPYLLKTLGQSEYGIYSLANTVIAYFTLLDFGFGNAIIKFTAKFKAEGNKYKEKRVLGMFLLIYSLIGLITLVIGAVIILYSDSIFSSALTDVELKVLKPLLVLAVFNVALSFPLSLYSSVINAYEHYVFIKLMKLIRSFINPLFIVAALMFKSGSFGIILATTLVNLIFNVVNIYYCYHKLSIKIKFLGFDKPILKEISTYSFYIFLGIIVDKIFWNTDQLLLGINKSSNSKEIAVYALSVTFTSIFISLTSIIGQLYLPRFTTMMLNKCSDKDISDEFVKVSRLQFFICSYVFIGFLIVGKEFIITWAGIEYINTFYICAIIMASLVAGISQNVGIAVLQAKNLVKFRSFNQLFFAVINIILTWILIPIYGGIGAAISTFIAHFIGIFITMSIFYQKRAMLDVLSLWKGLARFFPGFIICGIISYLINQYVFVNISGYYIVILMGLFFTILYCVATYLLMNNYEKQIVLGFIKKINF